MHSLIPDFILDNFGNKVYQGEFPSAGLFTDISGFSNLTSTLMHQGQHGAEVLAGVMQAVFAPLAKSVYAQGGFIVNFAGDAFTALFPEIQGGSQPAMRALAAAREIQASLAAHPSYATPYGEFHISAKIGLALGEAQWGILVSEDSKRAVHYFRGTAVEASAAAEHQANPGEILLDSAIRATLGELVSTEPVGVYYRVVGVGSSLPPPQPVALPVLDPSLLALFFPPSVLDQPLNGEFRQAVNVFINLPTVRTETQLEIFMQSVFELQDRYGGLLNRLDFGDKGSNLLLFWGAPIAHENDVERVLDFLLGLQTLTSIPLSAGVTYQIAHAGFIGSELREEYTCYGQGVNLAARFMTSAPRGEIWLDESAARRVEQRFELEFAGEQAFKGFTEKQKVYVLLDRKEEEQAFFKGAMVGREEELGELARFVQPIFSGSCAGTLVIWGEPGIGKSRLIYEFKTSRLFQEKEVLWAVCQVDEILREPLNPFRYWLQRYFSVSKTQVEARNKRSFNRKLDSLIKVTQDEILSRELDRTRSFLGALLGLHWPDSLYEQLDARGRYENSMIALITLLEAESLQQPVVLIIEDAHWLDDDSKAFLPRLARSLAVSDRQDFPIAILATARFEGAGLPLGEALAGRTIDLGGLRRQDLQRLAEITLGKPPDPDLLSLLEQRSEGNPFFAEQTLRYLFEEGRLEQRDAHWQVAGALSPSPLPDDVRLVLVARLDRLAREVRETVQTASVLGREFEVRLLARMMQDSGSLIEKIAQAEQAAIWSALTEIRYIFKHAMLRDVAYRMQLRARRKSLHALASEAIEEIYGADLSSHYGELAYHTEKAGLMDKARIYLQRAGDIASKDYQNNQAVQYYNRALALTPEEDLETRYHLLLAREELYDLLGKQELQRQDLDSLDRLVDRFEAVFSGASQAGRRAEVAVRRAGYFLRAANYSEAGTEAGRAISLSEERAPKVAAHGYWYWSTALHRQGNFEEARHKAETGLNLARQSGDRRAESGLLNMLGMIAAEQQDPATARSFYEQSIEIGRQLQDRRAEARPLSNMGNSAAASGDYPAARIFYEQSLQIAREIGDRNAEGLLLGNLGWISGIQGDYSTARTFLEQNLRIAREVGDLTAETYATINLSSVVNDQVDYPAALAYAQQALGLARQTGDRSAEAWSLTFLGHSQASSGSLAEAEEAYQAAVVIRRALGQPNLFTEPLAGLAQVALALGDLPKAQAGIQSILEHLENGGTLAGTEHPLQVYLACYQVLKASHDRRANDILKSAYRLLQERAGQIKDEGTRQAFLENIPYNREILEAWGARIDHNHQLS